MSWTAYGIMPIDFGWEMLPSLEEVATRLAKIEAEVAVSESDLPIDSLSEGFGSFMKNFEQAKKLAKSEGWEGDYRNTPRVFWIPDENEFVYGFVWKQDNNGNTFVVSPRPLKWLEALR